VSFCGIIEKHMSRFICKKIHQIAHKCGLKQEGGDFFWCALRFVDKNQESKRDTQIEICMN
jgi:hypothetical protein